MYRLTSHFIAQIIQVVETAAYRRMLVRVQLERLSFVGEMIYLTVELNFHKTIIYYSRPVGVIRSWHCASIVAMKVAIDWVETHKELCKVNRSNTCNIRQVCRKGRLE